MATTLPGLIGIVFALHLWLAPASLAGWKQVKKEGTLHLATEGTFRPFNYSDEPGPAAGKTLTGFEVELANALAKKLGLKSDWTTRPFDQLLTGLALRKYDLVAASHAITPERAKTVEFINPHYCTGATIVTRAGGPGSLKALAGKTIGVTVGTTYYDRLNAMGRFKEIKVFRDDAEATDNLVGSKIDAWVTDRFVAAAMLKARKDAGLDVSGVLFPEMVAMAVAKGDSELKDKVNGALAALFKDGTYARLSERYFGQDISCKGLGGRRAHGAAQGD
ncbi:MAG: amino acid ABC transporter substrate-binding protein [Deltaproteobacteria bacterium]|nr:amino acid ABC transporter substrate-binding protein [Deltaproteobacteria bacterium]